MQPIDKRSWIESTKKQPIIPLSEPSDEPEPKPLVPKTPMTSKSIRRAQQEYALDPIPRKLEKLFWSQQQLAA